MKAVMAWGLLALLLAPWAVADHVYSHRLVVEGRLVGSDGAPLPGVLVNVSSDGFRLGPACAKPQPRTDAFGDFWFCFHNHALPDEGTILVNAANASRQLPLDPDLRRMVVLLQDDEAPGKAPAEWASRYRVEGRLWWRMEIDLDSVDVHGLAMVHEPVLVELAGTGAAGSRFDVTTDAFGDYEATFDLLPGQPVSDLEVRVHARNATLSGRLDPLFHRSVVHMMFPMERAEGELLPGTGSAAMSPGLALTVVGVAAAMVALQLRKS